MRRNSLFWGALLIVAGILFLLNTMGILAVNVWGIIWPLFIIIIGVQLLTGFIRPTHSEVRSLSIPLESANQANVFIHHGAGRITLGPGSTPSELLSGTFEGGVNEQTRKNGATTDLTLRTPDLGFPFWTPFDYPRGLVWSLNLTREIPLMIEVHTGASESDMDLSQLRVTELRLETGASSTRVTLPEQAGYTRVRVSSGAASLNLQIPSQVAARIEVKSGLAGINIDQNRFPRTGNLYETPGYASAANRADIFVETGVASVDIH